MLKDLTTLELFFIDPMRVYSARELAKNANMSHITIAKQIQKYDFIKREKNGPYLGFKAKIVPEFLRMRFFYNYQKIFKSGLIDFLNSHFDYPTMILFGSYAKAENVRNSDIDICIISQVENEPNLKKFETKLGLPIQLFIKSKSKLHDLKKDNPHLLNSICNGIVLQGELEVFG
ncbi:MAG: nucleotidyltransferase domain-containing protein [Candidatus Woesearchaeota archaeon]